LLDCRVTTFLAVTILGFIRIYLRTSAAKTVFIFQHTASLFFCLFIQLAQMRQFFRYFTF